MRWPEIIKQVILNGGPGTCQFAITNICNAGCSFCNFAVDKLPKQQRKSVSSKDGIKAIDILHRHGIRFIIFTGGEPTVHPNLEDFLIYSKSLNINTLLVTNGSTLNPTRVSRLIDCGLQTVIISLDATEASVHEKNRRLPGVVEKISTAVQEFRRHGVGTTASVTLSRLIKDLNRLPDFLEQIGFESVTFSFPLTHLNSSYLGAADSPLVTYDKSELHRIIDAVKQLKSKFPVLNPTASLEDMHRHLDQQEELFDCLGGYKQFYLDWDLQLWRCSSWSTPMCHVFEYDGTQQVRDGCQACMVDCYRDASVLQYVAVALNDGLRHLCKGRLDRALKLWFSRKTMKSIQAVWENSFWMTHMNNQRNNHRPDPHT